MVSVPKIKILKSHVYFLVARLHRLLNITTSNMTTPAPQVISQKFLDEEYSFTGSLLAVSCCIERFIPTFMPFTPSSIIFCYKEREFSLMHNSKSPQI